MTIRRSRKSFATKQERNFKMVEAAYLASLGATQERIVAEIGWSQRTVARLLEDAREKNILGNPRFNLNAVQDEEIVVAFEKKYQWKRHDDLHQRINAWRPEGYREIDATVCSAGADMFGTAAARLGQLLQFAKLIGLMYGRTVRELITAVKHHRTLVDHAPNAQCVPLCGDPVYLMQREFIPLTASSLSADFDETVLGNRRGLHPTLTGIPAYVKSSYARQMISSGTWRYFAESPGYKKIFGKLQNDLHTGSVAALDAIVTGVGIVRNEKDEQGVETGTFIRERLIQEERRERTIRRAIVGDVGGLLVPTDGARTSDGSADSLNDGWTGVSAGDLLRVAQRADDSQPGVIVVAFHGRKAEVIRQIIRLGYVNHLIISDSLAARLIEMTK